MSLGPYSSLSPPPSPLSLSLDRYQNPGVGMRGGILYWHFVDIVWIAVYGIIYVAQL